MRQLSGDHIMVKFALPSPTIPAFTFEAKCKLAKKHGFHGIELFMFRGVGEKLPRYRAIASDYGLRLSLHQPWSYKESGGTHANRILELIGMLPKDGYRLRDVFTHANDELLVCYVDRKEEIEHQRTRSKHRIGAQRFAFQTTTSWVKKDDKRQHVLPFSDLIRLLRETEHPIVLDTFHALEWYYGGAGGNMLVTKPEQELSDNLYKIWKLIGRERIPEIHWNDCVPHSGFSDGRSCFPGNGVLRRGLEAIAHDINMSGWDGYVIPELSPAEFFPDREWHMALLRNTLESFFA